MSLTTSTYQWPSTFPELVTTFKITLMWESFTTVSDFPIYLFILLTRADDNASYFNVNMLDFNPTLLDQVAREYYANKTGM